MIKTLFWNDEDPLQHKAYDVGLLLLRLFFGGLMAIGHGWGKLTKLVNEIGTDVGVQFADPLGLGPTFSLIGAVGAEFFCALLLIFGLATRFATIPMIFTFIVAAFVVHAGDGFFLPQGKQEPAFMYACIYLCILILGPGRLSLDALIAKKLK